MYDVMWFDGVLATKQDSLIMHVHDVCVCVCVCFGKSDTLLAYSFG